MHQDQASAIQKLLPEISCLLQAATLKALQSSETNCMEQVLAKLDHLADLIGRAHRAEMQKIDSETDELARQITDLASQNLDAAEQAQRLRALAASLNAIGKTSTPPNPI